MTFFDELDRLAALPLHNRIDAARSMMAAYNGVGTDAAATCSHAVGLFMAAALAHDMFDQTKDKKVQEVMSRILNSAKLELNRLVDAMPAHFFTGIQQPPAAA
jgi:hypothetical protein